jgi:hypothetical protein
MTEERILSAVEAEGLTPSQQSLADYSLRKTAKSVEPTREKVPVTA